MSRNKKKTALNELEKSDINDAKRDLVMRFVKDQEALQTSQVDLKLIGDETIDIIDSAMVVKEEEEVAGGKLDETQNQQLSRDISVISLGGNDSGDNASEKVVAPRPPSRACRPKSRNRKLPTTKGNKRESKPSQELPTSFRHLGKHESASSENEPDLFSLRQKRRTAFTEYAIYSTSDPLHGCTSMVESYANATDQRSQDFRPKSTCEQRRIRSGEVITARKTSASVPERLACGISTLIGSASRPKSNYCDGSNINKNRKTFLNLGAIDTQVSLERPLGYKTVYPTEFSIFGRNPGTSSAGPCVFVQLPPISTKTPPYPFPPS